MAQQMSITQALAELKLLDKRIQKALDNVTWADIKTKSYPLDVEKFGKMVWFKSIEILNGFNK